MNPMQSAEHIAHGAYGCVLSYGDDGTKVVKLFLDKSDRDAEFKNNEIAKGIINLTLPANKKIDFTRSDVNEDALNACGIFDDDEEINSGDQDDEEYMEYMQEFIDEKKKEKIYSIIYERGGDDLSKASKETPFSILFIHLQYIFSGLVKLKEIGWAHCDIKPGNIVYTLDKTRLALIDFGGALEFTSLKTLDITNDDDYNIYNRLCGKYCYYPPEMGAFASQMSQKIQIPNNQNYLQLLALLKKFKAALVRENKNQYYEVINLFITRCTEFAANASTVTYDMESNKIDVYMFGATIINVMLNCMCNNLYDIIDEKINRRIINMVLRMISPIQKRRYNINTVYIIYKHILEKIQSNSSRTMKMSK
jgi:serine/threonine protein kinase